MSLSRADPGMTRDDYRHVFSALLNGLETPEIDVVRPIGNVATCERAPLCQYREYIILERGDGSAGICRIVKFQSEFFRRIVETCAATTSPIREPDK